MSGCPFRSSQSPPRCPFANQEAASSADPLIFFSSPDYPRPYVSAYAGCFSKFLDQSYPLLSGCPFYLQNSLFHEESIQKSREKEHLEKIVFANELREIGNRKFSKSQFEKALLCYEHALGLFLWAEADQSANTIEVKEPVESDPRDEKIRNGFVSQALLNISAALIRLKHFSLAEETLFEAFQRTQGSVKVLLMRCYLRAYNKESDAHLLHLAYADIQRAKTQIPEAESLVPSIEGILKNTYKKECKLYEALLKDTRTLVGSPESQQANYEFSVIEKLHKKYNKIIAHYKDNPAMLSQIEEERAEVQKIFSKMKKIIALSPKGNLLQKHAGKMNIDFADQRAVDAFENAKRLQLPKVFNKGNFNQKMLYQSIQECVIDSDKLNCKPPLKEETESFHWEQAVLFFLVAVLIMHFLVSPSSLIYNF